MTTVRDEALAIRADEAAAVHTGGGAVRTFTLRFAIEQVVGPAPSDEQVVQALINLMQGEALNFMAGRATRHERTRLGTVKVRLVEEVVA